MTLICENLANRHLRAPRANGGTLIQPCPGAIGQLLTDNQARLASADYDVQGMSLPQLAAQARKELVEAAYRYTTGYRDAPRPKNAERLFLAGHQPEMFHPGVWYKNFVLSALARRHDALAINLVIDSDTIKSAALRVPTGSAQRPGLEAVAFDHPSAEIPFAQRSILDRDLFASFGRRAAAAIAPLVADPLLTTYWPLVLRRAEAVNNLGLCLAQARHQLEGEWGAATLELPQTEVCSLASFRRFTAHLLAHLPRFWDLYNAAVVEYRQANHIRSTAHPVPELASDDGWLEAPFWIWTAADPHRRRLFVRQQHDQLLLSDRGQVQCTLDVSPDGDLDAAIEQLAALADRGVKLRTRAIITTLMARLVLGDVFMHGIGGAKYDQLTDNLIQRFFGLEPPGFMVASATLQLPIARPRVEPDDLRRINRELRDLEFHPEQHLRSVPAGNDRAPTDWSALVAEKQRWIQTPQTVANAKERCRAIRQVNAALQSANAHHRQELIAQRERTAAQLRAEKLLASREFGFCLYPEATLRGLLTGDLLDARD